MGAVTIQQMADRVAELMEQRLRIRGKDLAEKLKKGGNRLPRDVRAAANHLAEAAHMSQNPKLLLQIDEGRVAECYDICVRHMGGSDVYKGPGMLAIVGTRALYILVTVAALVIGLALWRGVL
jgi:hypothetical protein